MSHQSDKLKASITRFAPGTEAKKTEEKKEGQDKPDPSALSN